MPTFNVFLDKRRSRGDGNYPIKIRITHERKTKEVSTGYLIPSSHYNSKTKRVNSRNPNAKQINLAIQQQINKLQEKAIKLELSDKSVLEGLLEENRDKSTVKTLEFISEIVSDLQKENRIGNSLVYDDLKRSFGAFIGKDVPIAQVNYRLISNYERYLRQRELKTNSIAVYLRTLRAVCNKAIKLGYLDKKNYPFDGITIQQEATRKRALDENDIRRIEEQERDSPLCCPKSFAIAVFLFSFRTRGMSFVDIAHLNSSNIQGGRIVYRRKKSRQLVDVLVTPKLETMLEGFANSTSERLLPLLNERAEQDPIYRKQYLKGVLKRINKQLKRVGEELGFDQPLTTYVARHSWATIARKKGYSIELIAQAMGHSYGNKVTQIYLEPFDREVVDEMQLNVSG